MKPKKLKDKITKQLIFILSIVILVCSILLIRDLKEEKDRKSGFEELAQISNVETEKSSDTNYEEVMPDLQKLFEKNSDTVGWIKIEGTSINYPVMQKENDYYLHRDLHRELFPAVRCENHYYDSDYAFKEKILVFIPLFCPEEKFIFTYPLLLDLQRQLYYNCSRKVCEKWVLFTILKKKS